MDREMVDVGDHKAPAAAANALMFHAKVAHWDHMSVSASALDFMVWAQGFQSKGPVLENVCGNISLSHMFSDFAAVSLPALDRLF
jgi:hypothetical protein